MSIEQKIAELLAESKAAEQVVEEEVVEEEIVSEEADELDEEELKVPSTEEEPNSKKNNVKTNPQGAKAVKEEMVIDVTEDVAALTNGEELSEEFKTKAATIFEAAVVNRVKTEMSRLEEEFDLQLQEAVSQSQEALVEKVDGYLNYVVETWIAQNEIALERGMKSDILENFVSGLKDLFVESWIDVPEDKYDVLADMETQVSELQAKLDEQLAANVEMNKTIAEQKRSDIVKTVSEGLTDTETEKFNNLVEELSYEDAESFETKVKTIRENYFTTKVTSGVKSVVTDAPVENLTEEVSKKVDPTMSAYLSALNKNK